MRRKSPFRPDDLADLGTFLDGFSGVVAMQEVAAGNHDPDVVGMRHDVDHRLDTAVRLAEWERDRGYRSTYFVLHHAPYWDPESADFLRSLERLAILGHEVTIHANSLAEALRLERDPHEILHEAIDVLRGVGLPVRGVAAHGDHLCRPVGFVNDEVFAECARPEMGPPDRELEWRGRHLRIAPVPLAEFGLTYETYRLPKRDYLSDSGGEWNRPFTKIAGQLHMLVHWDWWTEATATTA